METTEQIMPDNVNIVEQVESIKLLKNSKGYNWEIKIIGIDLKRLAEINMSMEQQYGKQI